MSIHILVPQERLAELLKKEHELMLLRDGGVDNWSGFYESRQRPQGNPFPLSCFEEDLDTLVAKNRLAEMLGYEYTVNTDAAYFTNLEDMLGGEE